MSASTTPSPLGSILVRGRLRWRVVDIVVAAVLAVAGGVILLGWNTAGVVIGDLLAPLLPGLQALIAGIWLLPGLLVALVVRKPGAAVFGELVAATVSMALGAQWGLGTIESGIVQGLGAEIVFAILLYRIWSLPVALLAGAASGAVMGVNDLIVSYPGSDALFSIVYLVAGALTGAVLAGGLSWLLVRGLARTGALSRFAAGRTAERV